ncbi:MAG TPA: DNA integrity scanning protein DisA nucleotide-binding domain protein [Ureibacillus sp.]|nr:DNA integrity scanning protein DisA nucleotide-binding domain protein [Ureibacillus sp.]
MYIEVENQRSIVEVKDKNFTHFNKEYYHFFDGESVNIFKQLDDDINIKTYLIAIDVSLLTDRISEALDEMHDLEVLDELGVAYPKDFTNILYINDINVISKDAALEGFLQGQLATQGSLNSTQDTSQVVELKEGAIDTINELILSPWLLHKLKDYGDQNDSLFILPKKGDFYLASSSFVFEVFSIKHGLFTNKMNLTSNEVNLCLTTKSIENFFKYLGIVKHQTENHLNSVYTLEKSLNNQFHKLEDYYRLPVHHNDIIRLAAKDVFENILEDVTEIGADKKLIHQFFPNGNHLDLMEITNFISSLTYEGAVLRGRFLLYKDDTDFDQVISLKNAVDITNYRVIRKLLETTKDQMYLLFNGKAIIGLGLKNKDTGFRSNAYEIIFKSKLHWEIKLARGKDNSEVIFSIKDGTPTLKSTKNYKQGEFENKFYDAFNSKEYDDIWNVVKSAMDQKHGTMLVITNRTEKEADRLSNQGFLLDLPAKLPNSVVNGLTSIDGALLLDTSAKCYSFGLILDGKANDLGDLSRGARYNSAIRYIELFKEQYKGNYHCLVIIVSEDGMINIFSSK